MSRCRICPSYAINPSHHGRDETDQDLCDVCYWRTRAPQWQPIESAPLDTDILVFLMDEHLGPMFRVVFNSCSGEWSDGLDVYSPTHWQPLPAPPEVK